MSEAWGDALTPEPSTLMIMDPRATTEAVVGRVEWTGPTEGYCACPGANLHTTAPGPKDCRVRIDGAPTLYCFHDSCRVAVEKANHELRRRLGSEPWTLVLPGGRVLKSGEELVPSGRSGVRKADDVVLAAVQREAEARAPEILRELEWPYEEIVRDSPLVVADRDPDEQFRMWLKLWPPHSTLWIGDVVNSGSPEQATHFRTVGEWFQIGPVMGNFTCGSSFKAGSYARTDANVAERNFLVVESDTLSRDEVGAVFVWLERRLRYRLHCIIDTGGKSLHGWFSPPPPRLEARLKVALTAMGCDPKLFNRSQPVRVPGAMRGEKLQRLIWVRE